MEIQKGSPAKYDIIIIGAGSAGLSVSLFMAKVGLKTLLIDRDAEHLGGDCLNHGCIPSKALLHVARTVYQARRSATFGLNVMGSADMGAVLNYVRQVQLSVRQRENEQFLREQGITVALGLATFHSKDEVSVANKIYRGRKIIIATGSRPVIPPIPGLDKTRHFTNESIFDLKDFPRRLLVIGGGPVAIELGQALHRLGSKVTLVTHGKTILPHDPKITSGVLQAELEKEGIRIITNSRIREFTSGEKATVHTADVECEVEFDAVLIAAGREVVTTGLNVDAAGIRTHEGKIITDDYLRTTNPRIFVCGDVAGRLKFSHEAEHHARILINNFFSPIRKKLKDQYKSWVTFSDPQVATFGLDSAELEKAGVHFETIRYNFDDDDRAATDGYRYGTMVLYTRKLITGKKILLGGSVVAPDAGEMIQELQIVMAQRLSVDVIFDKIYPYPVSSRVNQLAIVKSKETQLTPLITKVLRALFRL